MAKVAEKLRGRSELMQAVYLSVIERGADTPEEMAEITGGNPSTVRSYARRLEKMQLLQRDSHGKYAPAEEGCGGDRNKNGAPGKDAPKKKLTKAQMNAIGNAGVIFRDANTGKVFFSIDFPEYMRVWNPYVIDVEEPGANDSESEAVENGKDVS